MGKKATEYHLVVPVKPSIWFMMQYYQLLLSCSLLLGGYDKLILRSLNGLEISVNHVIFYGSAAWRLLYIVKAIIHLRHRI